MVILWQVLNNAYSCWVLLLFVSVSFKSIVISGSAIFKWGSGKKAVPQYRGEEGGGGGGSSSRFIRSRSN